jgi:hypothetical protein
MALVKISPIPKLDNAGRLTLFSEIINQVQALGLRNEVSCTKDIRN